MAVTSQLSFILGFSLSTLAYLAIDHFYPPQAMLQATPIDVPDYGHYILFEIQTSRATREHSYVIPQFTLPEYDGSDEGRCDGYSEHWYGLCVPR